MVAESSAPMTITYIPAIQQKRTNIAKRVIILKSKGLIHPQVLREERRHNDS